MNENLGSLYRLIIHRVRVQVFISDWDGAKVSSYLLFDRKQLFPQKCVPGFYVVFREELYEARQ